MKNRLIKIIIKYPATKLDNQKYYYNQINQYQGYFESYWKSGNIVCNGQYFNDQKFGVWKWFKYIDAKISFMNTLKTGTNNGIGLIFYEK